MREEKQEDKWKKHRHQVKKMTTTALSQEGQPKGDSQQQESMAHHAKYLWSRSREMSKQQLLHLSIRGPSIEIQQR